jgi:hypothetical protein
MVMMMVMVVTVMVMMGMVFLFSVNTPEDVVCRDGGLYS